MSAKPPAAEPTLAQVMSAVSDLKASLEGKIGEVKIEVGSIRQGMDELKAELGELKASHQERSGETQATLDRAVAELSSMSSQISAVEQHVATLGQRNEEEASAASDESMSDGDGEGSSGSEHSGEKNGFALPLSKVEALPLELQLLIAEQLDYKALKRLQLVCKSMRALVVSTRSPILDDTLWRTRYSLEALQAARSAHKKRGERFFPKLHPIVRALVIMGGDTYEEIKLDSVWSTLLLCQNVKICKENATAPPVGGVCFTGLWENHQCEKRTEAT